MKVKSKYHTLLTHSNEYDELCIQIQEKNSILFYGSNATCNLLEKYFTVIKIKNIDLVTIASQRIIPDSKFIGCFLEISNKDEFSLFVDIALNLYMSGNNIILKTDITLKNIFPTNCIITKNKKNIKRNMSCIYETNFQIALNKLFLTTSFRPEYKEIISPIISNKNELTRFVSYMDNLHSFDYAINVAKVSNEFVEILINRNIETIINDSENIQSENFENMAKLKTTELKNLNKIRYTNKLGNMLLNVLTKIKSSNKVSVKPKTYLNNVTWEFVDLYFKVITRKFDYLNFFEDNKYSTKEVYKMKSNMGILSKLKIVETFKIYPAYFQEMDIEIKKNLDCSIPKTIIYIGDELTYQNIKSYGNVINIAYEDCFSIEYILQNEHNIDMLFVESCWRGKNNSWRNIVNNCGNEIIEIIELFKKHNIPVVFMAKEDPIYFNTFKNVASVCDVIITTSQDMVSEYKKINAKSKIMVEQYFINERLFNPYICSNDENKIFFAGGFYPRFTERTKFLKNFSLAINSIMPFHIYDRNYGKKSLQNFPNSYDHFIVGGNLSLNELVKVTSNYKYSLNLSSIVDDNTMIARRIFEQIALGKIQISNYSKSLEKLDDYAIIFDKSDDMSKILVQIKNSNYTKVILEEMALNILAEKSTYTIMNKLYDLLEIELENDIEIYIKDVNEKTNDLLKNQTKSKRNKIVKKIDSDTIVVTNSDLEDRHLLFKLLIKGE